MFGYQLVQETARQSQGKFLTKEGSLYPVLYKLMEAGYVSSYEVHSGARMRRYYYHLEDLGREYYQVLLNEFHSLFSGIRLILKEETAPENKEEQ